MKFSLIPLVCTVSFIPKDKLDSPTKGYGRGERERDRKLHPICNAQERLCPLLSSPSSVVRAHYVLALPLVLIITWRRCTVFFLSFSFSLSMAELVPSTLFQREKIFSTILPCYRRHSRLIVPSRKFPSDEHLEKKTFTVFPAKCKQFVSFSDGNKLAIWRKKFPPLFRRRSDRTERDARIRTSGKCGKMDINSARRVCVVLSRGSRAFSLIRRREEDFPLNPLYVYTYSRTRATRDTRYTRARSGTSGRQAKRHGKYAHVQGTAASALASRDADAQIYGEAAGRERVTRICTK